MNQEFAVCCRKVQNVKDRKNSLAAASPATDITYYSQATNPSMLGSLSVAYLFAMGNFVFVVTTLCCSDDNLL